MCGVQGKPGFGIYEIMNGGQVSTQNSRCHIITFSTYAFIQITQVINILYFLEGNILGVYLSVWLGLTMMVYINITQINIWLLSLLVPLLVLC